MPESVPNSTHKRDVERMRAIASRRATPIARLDERWFADRCSLTPNGLPRDLLHLKFPSGVAGAAFTSLFNKNARIEGSHRSISPIDSRPARSVAAMEPAGRFHVVIKRGHDACTFRHERVRRVIQG